MFSRKKNWKKKKNKRMCMPSFSRIKISNVYNKYSVYNVLLLTCTKPTKLPLKSKNPTRNNGLKKNNNNN